MELSEFIKDCHQHVRLVFTNGNSDKEYNLVLKDVGDGWYNVSCFYGRRGKNLNHVDKGTYSSLLDASLKYDKIKNSKISKGYVEAFSFESGKDIQEDYLENNNLTCSEDERNAALERLREGCLVW